LAQAFIDQNTSKEIREEVALLVQPTDHEENNNPIEE